MLVRQISGTFVEAQVAGQTVRFFVHNAADIIQRHHMAGEFYESEDLELIARYLTPTSGYLDVGANVGNHIVYLCRIAGLRHATAIEPNGQAIALLRVNLLLNGLEGVVDTSLLGYGLANVSGTAGMLVDQDNLGSARFTADAPGRVDLRTGDELLGGRDFDFVKIDVEGMEMSCLAGMTALINRCRPLIYIEIDANNTRSFEHWCLVNRYVVRERLRHYTFNENYLIAPA